MRESVLAAGNYISLSLQTLMDVFPQRPIMNTAAGFSDDQTALSQTADQEAESRLLAERIAFYKGGS